MTTPKTTHRRIIDMHSHYTVDFADWFTTFTAANGIEWAVNLVDIDLHAAADMNGPAIHTDVRRWAGRTPPRMLLFHMPNLDGIGTPEWEQRERRHLDHALAHGARGIKIWKNLGLWQRDTTGARLAVCDPRLDWLWTTAADHALPVTIHVGDAPAFFAPLTPANERYAELCQHPNLWLGENSRFPPLASIHDDFEELLQRHPKTTFTAAHFGTFLPFTRLHRMLGDHSNLYVDTAARVSDMGRHRHREDVVAIFTDFPDRVLFGTDVIRAATGPWLPDHAATDPYLFSYLAQHLRFFETTDELPLPLPQQGTWTIRGLGLPTATLDRLLFDNAARLLHLDGLS